MNLLKFVNLNGAWFLLALIPLIILYFLKLKRPRLEISSLVLWHSVMNDQRVNSPFQRFRRNLLLLLQMLLLFLFVAALMQPFLRAGAEVAEYTPILIDCSASMSAVDEASGKTRLDLIREQVREQIVNLRGDQKISLFSFSSTGRRLTEFTNDRRLLLSALEKIEPSDLPARLDDVMRMAAAYTRSFPIRTVVVLTDGNLPERIDFELPFTPDIRRVEPGGPNLGITEMTARRSSANEWEVFLRVAASATDSLSAELTILENGTVTHTEAVDVADGESERLIIPISAESARLVEARLQPSGFDSMSTDNSVILFLPATRPLRIRTSATLQTWRHAASVLQNVELSEGTPEEKDGAAYDLVVSDEPIPETIEAPVRIMVGMIPPDLTGMIEVRPEVGSVVDWNRTAPLLRHVQLADLQIGEQPAWVGTTTVGDIEERGYEVLVDGKSGPLLLQKREGLQTTWWFLFHTDRSTLPYRVGFPIIAANAVETALKQASLSEIAAAPTGVLPAIPLEATRNYSVRTPSGELIPATSNAAGTLNGVPASRVGRYDILEGDTVVATVGTGLLNTEETRLSSVEEVKFADASVKSGEADDLESDRPLWWTLAILAFCLMLFEWWYFQRARGALE